MFNPVIAFLILLCPSIACAQLAASTFKTGSAPSWVEWAAFETEALIASDQSPGGQAVLLLDTQANPAKAEGFVHMVKQITAQSGVQNGATLDFDWDPSFQELTIHRIIVHRGTNHFDRLDPAKFKLIQQETDLSRHIYNGTQSAVLFLEDIRVGDLIEYAFTVAGVNPSLKGLYSETFGFGWGFPIKHRRVRLLWPAARSLKFRMHRTSVMPTEREDNGIKEYIWDSLALPAVVAEDQTPSWFVTYPFIQVSEFRGWSEVASWAAGLYITTNQEAAELKEAIANLRHPDEPAEQTIQRALEFVQNEIRYLGIEFGPNSYHPTDPATVLQRRFGDCKDKAFVLCTFLHGLGYEATPVLVATGFRHSLLGLLPAPHDFDHVIVRVIAEGKTYWLDPTRTYQRGPIDQRYLPDYGFGLVVRAGESKLTRIRVREGVVPETITSEEFQLGDQGSPARLSVMTTYKSVDAEWMRTVLAENGSERLAKAYLNDYAPRYPDIALAGPMAIGDSPSQDLLTIFQTYTITNFWVLSPDKQKYSCQLYPAEIKSWVSRPVTAIRSMPMELSFPRRRIVSTKINLPREFGISGFTNVIAGPAAELKVSRTHQGLTVWLNYEYDALTNFVPASLTGQHLSSLSQMESALGYSLNWQNMNGSTGSNQFNLPIFMLVVGFVGSLVPTLVLLYRRQSRSLAVTAPSFPPYLDSKLNGLGGWLILVGFGLLSGVLQRTISVIQSSGSYSLWRWHALTQPGGVSYQPGWWPLLSLELLGQIGLLVLNVFVVILFFQKRRLFPRWCIAYWVAVVIFGFGDVLGVQMVKPSSTFVQNLSRVFGQLLVFAGVWIPYLCKSQRVKITFVQ